MIYYDVYLDNSILGTSALFCLRYVTYILVVVTVGFRPVISQLITNICIYIYKD